MADPADIVNHVATSTGLPPETAHAAVQATLTKVAANPVHTGDGVILVGGGRPVGPRPVPPRPAPPQPTQPQPAPPQTSPPASAMDETKQCPQCGQTIAEGYVVTSVGPGLLLYSPRCGFMKYRFGK